MILAVDIGSSSLRAAVFTPDGQLQPETLTRRSVAPTTTADGGMTYDAPTLFLRVTQVVGHTLRRAEQRGCDLHGVGVAVMMHSLVGVRLTPDGAPDVGGPTTPVFAWGDARSETERAHLAEYFTVRRLYARTGCPLHSSYWPLKLLRLKRVLDIAEWRWMSFAEYVWLRLFGVAYAGVSLASATGLYARRADDWDAEILSFLGLTRHNLTPIAADDFALDGDALRPPFRRRWSALRRAKFFPPLGDGACGNLGGLCVADGQAAVNVGTTAALRVAVALEREPATPPPGLWSYRLDRRRALVGGALSNAGNLLVWAQRTLRLPPARQLEDALRAAPSPDDLPTVLPFWAGERSLGWSPDAVGVVIGLRLATDAVTLRRALAATLAVRLAWIAGELEAAGLLSADAPCVVSGGVAASAAFATMLCHALGRPLYVTREEVSARGAALWAALRLGLTTLEQCPPPAGRWFAPDAALHDRYRAYLRRHRAAYDKLFGDSRL